MRRFDAYYFFLISRNIGYKINEYPQNYNLSKQDKDNCKDVISRVETNGDLYNFTSTHSAYRDVLSVLDDANFQLNGSHIEHQFNHLYSGLLFDLKREAFFHMPESHAKRYNAKDPFGVDVTKDFPSALFDVLEAGNCFACGRYTASVYHSMRVLEHGLNAFLTEFPKLTPRTPNWGDILGEIEKEVTGLPKSHAKKEQYLGLVTDFKIFKDAWRNDVAHIGSQYKIDDADSIYRHVRRFMQGLAKSGYKE